MNYVPYISPPNNNRAMQVDCMVPNINSIGGTGYNNGLYYNNYNRYNPYNIREQQLLEEKRRKEEQDNQNSILKIMYKCAGAYYHNEITDEDFDKRLEMEEEERKTQEEFYKEYVKYQYDSKLVHNLKPDYVSQRYIDMCNNQMSIENQYNSMYPQKENTSLYDFLSTAGSLYVNVLINESIARQNDLTQLYNRNAYSQLVSMHGDSRFNAFNPNFNMDDLEISLPHHLKKSEYAMRKEQFLNSILNK